MTITNSGLTIAETVARLYNASRVQGMGYLQAKPGKMTAITAAEEVALHSRPVNWANGAYSETPVNEISFDYLHGKVMKVRFIGDSSDFDPFLYDRDNGEGAALRAVTA